MRFVAHVFIGGLLALAQGESASTKTPIAVTGGKRIVDLSPEAGRAGVRLGMTPREALLVCPNLLCLPQDTAKTRAWSRKLLDACAGVTPLVEPAGMQEVFLGLGRSQPEREALALEEVLSRIFAGDLRILIGTAGSRLAAKALTMAIQAAFAAAVQRRRGAGGSGMKDQGQDAKAGARDPSPGWWQPDPELSVKAALEAAAAVERWAKPLSESVWTVHPRDEKEFLAALPVDFLWPIPVPVRREVKRLGVISLGHLARIPAAELVRRWSCGRQLADYSRGNDPSPILPLYPPRGVSCRLPLDEGGVPPERIHALLPVLAGRLARELESATRGCRRLALEFQYRDGSTRVQRLQLVRPAHLASSLHHGFLTMVGREVPRDAITGLEARAGELEPLSWVQMGLFDAMAAAPPAAPAPAPAAASPAIMAPPPPAMTTRPAPPSPSPAGQPSREEALASSLAGLGQRYDQDRLVVRGRTLPPSWREEMHALLSQPPSHREISG